MTWQLNAVLNGIIGLAYLAISWTIVRGLRRAGQLRSNKLALATAAIFLTCGIHHGGEMRWRLRFRRIRIQRS